MAFGPITSWQIDGEKMEMVTDCFPGLQNHCDVDCNKEEDLLKTKAGVLS